MQDKEQKGIGIAQVAEKLGTDGRTLRALVRKMDLGVGRGKRYRFTGMTDPAVKKIVAAYKKDSEEANAS